MRKIFTSLAAFAVVCSVSAADFSYTADPAEGVVEMLQFVKVSFGTLEAIDINSRDAISVTRDGAVVRGVDVEVADNNALSFTFGAEQTQPGKYAITIPAGTIAGYADSYAWMEDNPSDIVLHYTIENNITSQFDWNFTVEPGVGNVEEISDIRLTFPLIEELDINSRSDIVLSLGGVPVSGVKVALSGNNSLLLTPSETLTESGAYTLSIPAGTLCAYGSGYTVTEDNPEDIVLSWTIGGSSSSDLPFSFESSLPTEGYIAYFGELTLTFPEVESVEYAGTGLSVSMDGDSVGDVSVSTQANTLTLTLKDPLNFKEGEVVVAIAPGSLTAMADGMMESNSEEIKAAYHLATPLEFGLTLAISSPKPNTDGEISAEKSLESIFFVCEEKGLVAATGTETNVTIKEKDGDFEAKGHLRKSNGLNAAYSYFTVAFGKEPTYNGEYTITIDREAFGTQAWATDPNYGKTNEELTLSFKLVDGAERSIYTIEPSSVSPVAGTYVSGEDIASVRLIFTGAIDMAQDAVATLAGVDNSYRETAPFTVTTMEMEPGKEMEVSCRVDFDPAPTQDGIYRLTVAQGAFGDSGFLAGGEGHGSAPITIEYIVDHTVAADMVMVDSSTEIFSLQGIRMTVPVSELPAGIYIMGGRKVSVVRR